MQALLLNIFYEFGFGGIFGRAALYSVHRNDGMEIPAATERQAPEIVQIV
jgi:hypothetical protein